MKDNFNLTNSIIEANTSEESTGDGGSIFIDPVLINLDNSQIAVNSLSTGKGGYITIIGDILKMNNSVINAETPSNQVGLITLKIGNYLLFTNASEITATAGTSQSGGDGGNIRIDTPFILGFATNSNYQIIATAFTGKGGNIVINTNGIFGTQYIDITASSQGGPQGIVEINTPGVDPASGLTQLPSIPIDISALIKNSCQVAKGSAFTITGKGGLPSTPSDILNVNSVVIDWGNVNYSKVTFNDVKKGITPSVILTAKQMNISQNGVFFQPLTCQTFIK